MARTKLGDVALDYDVNDASLVRYVEFKDDVAEVGYFEFSVSNARVAQDASGGNYLQFDWQSDVPVQWLSVIDLTIMNSSGTAVSSGQLTYFEEEVTVRVPLSDPVPPGTYTLEVVLNGLLSQTTLVGSALHTGEITV